VAATSRPHRNANLLEHIMSNLRLLDPSFGDNFDTMLRRIFPASALEAEAPPLKMRIDVTENPNAYNVKADIPGVKKEDISVRVEGNVVQIEAETKSEKETKGDGDKVLRSERYYGTISRSFSLGQEVDATKVQAKYADGVLSLELPKKAPVDARRITVQ
jgi:HSP20 family protein